jgi:hypothetical protein
MNLQAVAEHLRGKRSDDCWRAAIAAMRQVLTKGA